MTSYHYTFTEGASDVNRDQWTTPQWFPPIENWPSWNPGFLPRTTIRNPYAVFAGAPASSAAVPVNSQGEAELFIGLYDPWSAGSNYLGSEIDTRAAYAATGTDKLTVSAQVRFPESVPGGAVIGFFLYGLTNVGISKGSPCAGGGCRDEVDFEFSTNYLYNTGGASSPDAQKFQVNTNVYLSASPNEIGEQVVTMDQNPINFGDLNELKIVISYTDGTIEWFINGTSVRTYSGDLPHLGMQVRLNFWVPGSDWGWAYNASFPAATSSAGTNNENFFTYSYLVKDVSVKLG